MLSKSKNVFVPTGRGTVELQPDIASIAVRIEVEGADPTTIPDAIQRAVADLERAAAPAVVRPISYRASSEKAAGKSLFGSSTRAAALTTCAVDLPLEPGDGFIARTSAVEAFRERLSRAKLSGAAFAIGDSRFVVSNPDAHRADATRALHAQMTEAAAACGMQVARLELDTALHVEVSGPCQAFVSLSGTAHLEPTLV